MAARPKTKTKPNKPKPKAKPKTKTNKPKPKPKTKPRAKPKPKPKPGAKAKPKPKPRAKPGAKAKAKVKVEPVVKRWRLCRKHQMLHAMGKYKRGQMRFARGKNNPGGRLVTSRKQALAIGLSSSNKRCGAYPGAALPKPLPPRASTTCKKCSNT